MLDKMPHATFGRRWRVGQRAEQRFERRRVALVWVGEEAGLGAIGCGGGRAKPAQDVE